MTPPALATTREEIPTYFGADDRPLFGVLTQPTIRALGIGVILLSGGGTPVSTYRNRLWVRLSRQLAARGYHVLRFDYHGVGESAGSVGRFRLDRPFDEDLRSAIRLLRLGGSRRFVLIGSCFGARTALACAPEIEDLEAVALIAPPVRDFEIGHRLATDLAINMPLWRYALKALEPRVLRRLFDPDHRLAYLRIAKKKWRRLARRRTLADGDLLTGASQGFVRPLASIALRGVPVLIIYGEQDDLWDEFQRARSGPLDDVLFDPGTSVDLRTIRGEVHGFSTVSAQDAVVHVLNDWLSRHAPLDPVVRQTSQRLSAP